MDENLIHVNFQPENIDKKQMKIMIFLMKALENGWSVKKQNDKYIFSKKHEGKKKYLDENYLDQFLQSNFDMPTISP